MTTADADATTQRIRSEALRLFAERGYGNTTIEHISTGAGVGVATIYRRWSDKAAIANELYREGIDAMLSILAERHADDHRSEFIAIWRDLWGWASTNRDLSLFISASAGAPWLTKENVARKAEVSTGEIETYARLGIDAAPDFAAALIGGTMASVLAAEPDIEADEVAERLWRALTLRSD
ncbi:MAG: helix-turn-helix domain-containing protein [Ilumatobacter sp.]|uniref:TetR/AcrR family transcriptional regulator n=1 Tax=Ilumatobacter sp. TaxID=1967498 RepID=UPI002632FFF8|nr:TetR/AcrR family transcriptional regulator [Ilumatobacter sp.]MDJ0771733.1 helix-turn-helix domain-containing protein [Ilumatobacter sp.]